MEKKNRIGLVVKTVLGMSFVSLACIIVSRDNYIDFTSSIIIVGLFFNSIGDIYLGLTKIDTEKFDFSFYTALLIISMSQILYLSASIRLGTFSFYTLGVSFLIILLAFFMFRKTILVNMKAKLALLYALPLTFVFINSIFNIYKYSEKTIIYFSVGVIMYWISDFILFIIKFKINDVKLDALNKVLYYSAQLVITYSLI